MNPIFFFDELDKVSQTPKGEEIIGILTHLTDASQNSNFCDRYYPEIPFDLSKALFFFSYNDSSKVCPILLDRMFKISTKGYNAADKLAIAKKFIIPAAIKDVGFGPKDIVFSKQAISTIIEQWSDQEKGVRALKRAINSILARLNILRLTGDTIPFKLPKICVRLPMTLTDTHVRKLLAKTSIDDGWKSMYI